MKTRSAKWSAGVFLILLLILSGTPLAEVAALEVTGWGSSWNGATSVPMTVPVGLCNVVAIAVSSGHSLAQTAEGRVVSWIDGRDGRGVHPVPKEPSDVVAIAAGEQEGLARTADGRVITWRYSYGWADDVPEAVFRGSSNVVAIAPGLALSGLPPGVAAPAWVGPRFLIGTVDRPFHHRIVAKNGVDTYGAVGLPPGLVLDPHSGLITGQAARADTYAVCFSATNRLGSCAWTVSVFINLPVPAIAGGWAQPVPGVEFSHKVVAYNEPVLHSTMQAQILDLLQGFEGVYSGWVPADPVIAAGPSSLVTMVSGKIAIFSKQGIRLFEQNLGAGGFWATVLSGDAFVGSTVTARCGDAPVSPPRPRPKSLVAGPIPFSRRDSVSRSAVPARKRPLVIPGVGSPTRWTRRCPCKSRATVTQRTPRVAGASTAAWRWIRMATTSGSFISIP